MTKVGIKNIPHPSIVKKGKINKNKINVIAVIMRKNISLFMYYFIVLSYYENNTTNRKTTEGKTKIYILKI